jgi:hypothetical protein
VNVLKGGKISNHEGCNKCKWKTLRAICCKPYNIVMQIWPLHPQPPTIEMAKKINDVAFMRPKSIFFLDLGTFFIFQNVLLSHCTPFTMEPFGENLNVKKTLVKAFPK